MSSRTNPRYPLVSVLMGLSLATACGRDKTYFRSLDDTGGPPAEASADAAPEYLKTFAAGQLETANLTIDSGFNLIQQDFLLVQAPKSAELSQQLDRTIYEDSFTQGHNGVSASQAFSISEAGIFDLLIVMDNSSSMGPYQNRISQNLTSILKYINNTNWRIAVVTTTNACLNKTTDGRKYITRANYDADPVKTTADFKTMIKIGEGGDPVEKGIKIAADAMTGQGCIATSNEWLRADSQRSILLITDEKNCGSGSNEGCAGSPYETAQYFYDRVGYNVPVNAFLLLQEPPAANPADPTDPNHDCQDSGGYLELPNPAEYMRMVTDTGGISSDICRSNYGSVLEQISLNVRKKINIQFELSHPAVATSLDIKLDGKKVSSFTVSGKTLTILEPVVEGSQALNVVYKHDPVAMVKSFTPSHNGDGTSFDVLVNGEKLAKELYHLDNNTGKLELNNIPPEHAQIKIKYRENVTLRKVFNYVQNFVPGSLEVWVDDKKVTNFTHDVNAKKVTFTTPPVDGAQVSLRYEMPGDRKLKYPILGADAARIENFRLVDRENQEELIAQVDNGNLLVDNDAIFNGRKVRAIYNMNYEFKSKLYNIAIAGQPFPDTLKIEAEGDENVCSQDVEVHADSIGFSCGDEDFEKVNISYQYAESYKNTFDLSVDYSGPKTYKVYVNENELTNYHIFEDKLVILKKDLPAGSTVKVLIQPR
ncbi:MAG TPA: vWA domain-containing protein [Oligoflexus sp.]|uniref:vWA domain-containing protein n=1 Tax=Oligoflexus sp. TaxID=1971216 RepID=UPI002D2B2DA9|nr:vWA domain-containing protein [Oligoflexus sp.]HYX38030.1 vWA domain-containing protein [Oligoflexus sp.]